MIDAQAPVEVFDEIDSTMLEARRRAERGELSPVWLIAKRQTAGRGRRGRVWLSFDGNLLATYLFATDRPPGEIALYSFAAGVAIAEAMEAMGVAEVALKWPNDVMVAGAKAAGILIDSGAVGPGRIWAALAFGVNLAAAPKAIDQSTRSVREALPLDAITPAPMEFFATLRPRLEAWAARLEVEGFAPLRRAWMSRAYALGAEVRVMQGDVALNGRITGLSERGELELDTNDGPRLISAGDVFLPSAA